MSILAGIICAFRMAQNKDDLFARSNRLQHIADIFKFKDFTRQRFTPSLFALVINVRLVLVNLSALDSF